MRDATINMAVDWRYKPISTHASLAGRDMYESQIKDYIKISTHASLAGRDRREEHGERYSTISTHASLAGRDLFKFKRRLF